MQNDAKRCTAWAQRRRGRRLQNRVREIDMNDDSVDGIHGHKERT